MDGYVKVRMAQKKGLRFLGSPVSVDMVIDCALRLQSVSFQY